MLTRDSAKGAVMAGCAAGSIATLAQLLLWLTFTDSLPAILYRDTRMAAAIALGPQILAAEMSLWLWLVAGLLHFALSIAYAGMIQLIQYATGRLALAQRLLTGAAAGALIYVINMYGFTAIYPWFTVSRELITFTAHLVFGMIAALDWLALLRWQAGPCSAATTDEAGEKADHQADDLLPLQPERTSAMNAPSDTRFDPAAIIEEFLRIIMIPDPDGARRFVSPDIRIRFTGGRAMSDIAECSAFNATRYSWVKKRFERTEVVAGATPAEAVVYNLGTLYGEWPDGKAFEGNRYVDRYVLRDGLITQMDVWNDSAEWLMARAGLTTP